MFSLKNILGKKKRKKKGKKKSTMIRWHSGMWEAYQIFLKGKLVY